MDEPDDWFVATFEFGYSDEFCGHWFQMLECCSSKSPATTEVLVDFTRSGVPARMGTTEMYLRHGQNIFMKNSHVFGMWRLDFVGNTFHLRLAHRMDKAALASNIAARGSMPLELGRMVMQFAYIA